MMSRPRLTTQEPSVWLAAIRAEIAQLHGEQEAQLIQQEFTASVGASMGELEALHAALLDEIAQYSV